MLGSLDGACGPHTSQTPREQQKQTLSPVALVAKARARAPWG